MSDTEKADMTSEIERLRERAAASDAALETARSLLAMLRSDLRGCELSLAPTERRATKAEAERDAALAQVAELRWALTRLILECDDAFDGDGPTGLIPGGVAYDDARAAIAATPAPEHDYSGLCSAPSCEGHCGYVHARGCEAVREYLADHGGKPYRAPSKAATRG